MDAVHFRRAAVGDIDALVTLRSDFLTEAAAMGGLMGTPPRDAMRDYFLQTIPSGEFVSFLAIADPDIIAISGMVMRRLPPSIKYPTGREAYIMNMYTRPAWRGRGLATELLTRLLAFAGDVGYGRIRLHTFPKSQPIYARAGFEMEDGEMRLDLPGAR